MSKPQRQLRFLTSTKHIFEIEVLHSLQSIAASLVVAILTELRHVRTRQTFGNERNGVARVQSCFECLCSTPSTIGETASPVSAFSREMSWRSEVISAGADA